MTEAQLRQKAVSVMQGWLGGRQGSAIHREIVDTYNSYKPHPRGHALTMSDAWCAGTVSAAAIRAGLTDIMPVECSCTRMIEQYRALGRWMEADDYIPAPGDLIFYDWADSGKGDNVGQPDHVGMVEAVSGRTITVIEGNYNSMVQRRALAVNGRYIRGFGCPDYAGMAAPEPAPKPEDSAAGYARASCAKAVARGAFQGDGTGDYHWTSPITRQDFCVVLDRLGLLD